MQPISRVRAGLPALQALASQTAIASQSATSTFIPKRNAVNLSALKLRIRATNNVAKITNVMKLVASSKLKSVEEALARGRVFGESILNAVALQEPKETAEAGRKVDEDAAKGVFLDDKRHLVTVVTTDRGLCGAVNSSLTRALRKELNAAARQKSNVRVFVLGDKGRAQVARDYMPIVARTVDNCFDKDPIFPLAAAVATKIVKEPYDVLTLWYNHYENQIKFHNVYKKIPQLAGMPVGVLPPSLKGYDIEPENNEEALINMQEYAIASALFYAMLETAACETSQRVTAMDNASTNAKDMVDRFKLIYNRARQSKITTELTEIISGAESLQAAGAED